MCFICWDTDVLSDRNIYTDLSMCVIMGHSTKTTINNEIIRINNISQHTSNIDKYLDFITDNITFF